MCPLMPHVWTLSGDLRCLKSQHPQERDLGTVWFGGFNMVIQLYSKSHRSQRGDFLIHTVEVKGVFRVGQVQILACK